MNAEECPKLKNKQFQLKVINEQKEYAIHVNNDEKQHNSINTCKYKRKEIHNWGGQKQCHYITASQLPVYKDHRSTS